MGKGQDEQANDGGQEAPRNQAGLVQLGAVVAHWNGREDRDDVKHGDDEAHELGAVAEPLFQRGFHGGQHPHRHDAANYTEQHSVQNKGRGGVEEAHGEGRGGPVG